MMKKIERIYNRHPCVPAHLRHLDHINILIHVFVSVPLHTHTHTHTHTIRHIQFNTLVKSPIPHFYLIFPQFYLKIIWFHSLTVFNLCCICLYP
jgi:hypothetical protein